MRKINVCDIVEIDGGVQLACQDKSSAGVSFEENMISVPEKPQASDIISSVREEQSTPQPSS